MRRSRNTYRADDEIILYNTMEEPTKKNHLVATRLLPGDDHEIRLLVVMPRYAIREETRHDLDAQYNITTKQLLIQRKHEMI